MDDCFHHFCKFIYALFRDAVCIISGAGGCGNGTLANTRCVVGIILREHLVLRRCDGIHTLIFPDVLLLYLPIDFRAKPILHDTLLVHKFVEFWCL